MVVFVFFVRFVEIFVYVVVIDNGRVDIIWRIFFCGDGNIVVLFEIVFDEFCLLFEGDRCVICFFDVGVGIFVFFIEFGDLCKSVVKYVCDFNGCFVMRCFGYIFGVSVFVFVYFVYLCFIIWLIVIKDDFCVLINFDVLVEVFVFYLWVDLGISICFLVFYVGGMFLKGFLNDIFDGIFFRVCVFIICGELGVVVGKEVLWCFSF